MSNIGTATAGKVLQGGGTGSSPIFSTATYPSTATGTGTLLRADGTNWVATTSTYPDTNAVSTLLYASSTNVMSALATANRAVLTTNTTGVPALTALATDGQLIIGSTAGSPAAASLTAGSNITITPGSNSITIAATGGGLTWSEETASPVSAAVNHGYIANLGSLLTFNLPGTFAVGDIIHIVGKGAGLWVIDAPAGDTIQFGNQVTSSGGTITATNAFDCIQIIGTTANSVWTCTGVSQGNLTVA